MKINKHLQYAGDTAVNKTAKTLPGLMEFTFQWVIVNQQNKLCIMLESDKCYREKQRQVTGYAIMHGFSGKCYVTCSHLSTWHHLYCIQGGGKKTGAPTS